MGYATIPKSSRRLGLTTVKLRSPKFVFAPLIAAGAAVALSSLALPANAATSAIQFGKIYYDQPGSDTPVTNTKLNSEYVVIKNTGTTTRTLTRWTVRDLANHVYTFPSFKLGAGKSVTLHTGKGTNTGSHLYWGKGWYIWNNTGDKAIVRDSTGVLKDTCTWGDGIGYTYC